MSLRQRVRLEYELDGKPSEVVAEYSAVDLRAWETAFGESALVADMSVSMLTWLGHHAAVRQGLLNGPLKTYRAFDEACTSVEGVRDDPPTPAPDDQTTGGDTRTDRGADSSAPLPSEQGSPPPSLKKKTRK